MRFERALAAALFFLAAAGPAEADTIHFKNGHTLEGIVLSEDDKEVQLDLGQGKARFKKDTIRRIERSDEAETQGLLQSFEKEKAAAAQAEAAAAEARRKKEEAKEYAPKKIDVQTKDGGIFVKVRLNGKEDATMLLDTGASNVLLTRKMADRLGIQIRKSNPFLVEVADGRKVKAMPVTLKSVEVQGMTAKNVDAAVLLKAQSGANYRDGLLGMSYLGRYTFKIDRKNSELTLEKNK
ncbi:MAG TPA: retropepsin-like aspartic protease [Candidatus Eisenbacteria bacterium]|nr:retropepsin-like aspartic protease [Candidatus Eisenbacteria bacterium]